MIAETALVGSWDLVRWQQTTPDGCETDPFGRGARGRILYVADGRMGGFLMHPAWPESAGNLADPAFIAYSGQWVPAGNCVTHHVDIASIPGWVGVVMKRRFVIDDDRLTLTAAPAGSSAVTNYLDFRRSQQNVTK